MQKNLSNFKIMIVMILLLPITILAQSITGKVTSEGNPVVGATVLAKPSNVGAATDVDGGYSLKLDAGSYTIVVSSVGYASKSISVSLAEMEDKVLNVDLKVEARELQEVVVLGSRSQQRTVTDSPLPIDIFSLKEISNTGQNSFDKILQYRVPSFNTVQTPVNDATALIDPWEIRNMGISRTLVLINGKRKNSTALVYTQTSPSRGEVGTDISSIPTDAIKRIEVLRDGASAQYGSDAIAGVINVVLKDNTDGGQVNINTGMTGAGDGKKFQMSLNNGSSIGDNTGFFNYTVDLSKVGEARRSGQVDAKADADDNIGFGTTVGEVQKLLDITDGTAGNRSSSPATSAAKFLFNAGLNLPGNTELYGNAAYVYKKVNSFANYRTPYWRTLGSYPYLKDFFGNGTTASYIGYVPTFDGDLIDYNATVGVKTKKLGWNMDASLTIGFNSIDYTILDSHNKTKLAADSSNIDNFYGASSPTTFKPGGTTFKHTVGNIDVSKALTDKLSVGFGTEFRTETFEVIAGDRASWAGDGADSYAGNRPENSGAWSRFNIGTYFDAGFDVTKNFFVGGTFRNEQYSDFGESNVFKVSSRLKLLNDKATVRGSYSTGFKAPSLHQIFTQRSQYAFSAGGAIQVIGLINNVSPQARILGVKKLTPEKSTNLTAGIGMSLSDDLNFTFDYYDIAVSDRIVISNRVSTATGAAEFFTNSISTKTSGIDVVVNYDNFRFANGVVNVSLAGNMNLVNEKDGDILKVKGTPVIDETQESLFFTSRPKNKFIAGVNYERENISLNVTNTYFGETVFHQGGIGGKFYSTQFQPKFITDLGVSYALNDNLTLNVNVNNVLDITPVWEFVDKAGKVTAKDDPSMWAERNLLTFNGRYDMMTYDGFHFSQLGRIFNFGVSYKF